MPDLATKFFELKALSAEGEFSAIISTDQVDRDGEIVARAAFETSLGKTIPLIQSHDWGSLPVGKGVVAQNAEGTTLTGSFFMDTAGGQEAYKTAKNMAGLQEFSVGFMPLKSDFVLMDGKSVRRILDMELFEASLVLVGASRGTRLTAIKSGGPDEEMTVEKALDFLDAEVKAGASISGTNLGRVHSILNAAMAMHDASNCDMGGDCPMQDMTKAIKLPEPERQKRLRELESALGYRPLIADTI